jgi:hypothetical protein
MGSGADPGSVQDDWVAGVPMYFASYTAEKNEELVHEAELCVTSARLETVHEQGGDVTFL